MTRPRLIEQRQAIIADAAEVVFARVGFGEATVAEITETAGVGIGTFYLHFPSKRDVLRFLLEIRQSELVAELDGAGGKSQGDGSSLRKVIHAFLAWCAERPAVSRLLREAEFTEPDLRANFYDALVEHIRGALLASGNGIGARSDPTTLAWGIVGVVEFAVLRSTAWNRGRPTLDASGGVIDFILRAVDA